MQNEWQGLSKAGIAQMLKKVDTSYSKEGLTTVAHAICNLPERQKIHQQNSKINKR